MSTKPEVAATHPRLYAPSLLPARGPVSRRRMVLRIATWIGVLGLYLVVLMHDVELMHWRYSVLPDGPRGKLKELVTSLRDFGQVLPIMVAALLALRLDRRRWTVVVAIILAQLFAKVAYEPAKFTIVRYRPNAIVEQVARDLPVDTPPPERGAAALSRMTVRQTWRGLSWYNRDSRTQSFPSGHSSASFALAGVLAWFYPPAALLFWVLAGGCALSRYADGVHWLSDCVAGASIGYASAWLALRPHLWWPATRRLQHIPGEPGRPRAGGPPDEERQ